MGVAGFFALIDVSLQRKHFKGKKVRKNVLVPPPPKDKRNEGPPMPPPDAKPKAPEKAPEKEKAKGGQKRHGGAACCQKWQCILQDRFLLSSLASFKNDFLFHFNNHLYLEKDFKWISKLKVGLHITLFIQPKLLRVVEQRARLELGPLGGTQGTEGLGNQQGGRHWLSIPIS